METFQQLKKIAIGAGSLLLLVALLALVLFIAGVDAPVHASAYVLGYAAAGILVVFGVFFGLSLGGELWSSNVAWKKLVGAVLLAISLLVGVAFAMHVYSGIDLTDCLAGPRYC